MMKLVVDHREPHFVDKCRTFTVPVEIVVENLPLGDFSLFDENGQCLILFERKSLNDLLASIKDGRYEEQSHRLLHSSGMPTHNIVYVVEGMLSQVRSEKERKLVFSAMTSLQYFKGFSVVRTSSVSETAEWVMMMADKIGRDRKKGKTAAFSAVATHVVAEDGEEPVMEGERDSGAVASSVVTAVAPYSSVVKKVKKENVTSENIGEILLCQIPGVSSTIAIELMRVFQGSFWELMKSVRETPERLDDIYLESNGKRRKLSKAVVANLKTFLAGEPMVPPAMQLLWSWIK